MFPGDKVLKGSAKPWIFMTFRGVKNGKKHEKPTLKNPLENPDPWDHAQMIERKILCRIALTRALYDQIRP